MMPSPSELKYFMEVANTLNMSRAAERIGISQPALTLAIKRLEQSFGHQVLIRSKTGVRLTRGGKRLVGRVRFLLEEWEKICDTAANDETEIRGTYSLGCHPSVGLYTLPHFVGPLLEENPGLELKVHHDLSRRITEDVISCRVDFGIAINPAPHPDLVIKNLVNDEVTFWVGPGRSPLQDPKNESVVLICDMELAQVQSLIKQVNRKGNKFSRTVTSSNLEVITSLVAAGAGVGILPSRVARRDPTLGLVPLSGQMPKFSDKCALIYRADTPKTESTRKIVQTLTQRVKEAHT